MLTLTVLAQVQNWETEEFWGFFAPQKKAEKSVKIRKIAEISAISHKIARKFIKSTIGGGYRVDLHR